MTLLSGNVGKYEVSTGKDVLPKKELLEKAATIKRFEYLPLGNELKKHTDIAEDRLRKVHRFDEEDDKTINRKQTIISNLKQKNI